VADHAQVVAADLVAHAGHVEAVGDRVIAAKQAGDAVRAGSGAYGQLCVMVPVMLGILQDVLISGISTAADSLHDTGGRLRAAAQAYEAADQRSAGAFDGIRGRM
jgi:hypothetical protein